MCDLLNVFRHYAVINLELKVKKFVDSAFQSQKIAQISVTKERGRETTLPIIISDAFQSQKLYRNCAKDSVIRQKS